MDVFERKISRRALLQGAAAATAGAGALAIAGCGDNGSAAKTGTSTATVAPAATKPAAISTPAPKLSWSALPISAPAPSARRDHSLTLDPGTGRVYLFGGRLKGASMNDMWSFDPNDATWREVTTAGPKPTPRFAHTATYDPAQKRLVIATGQGDGEKFFNDVWAFDLAAGSWRELGAGTSERPEIRYGAGGAHDIAGNRIFVSHGFTDHGRFDDTWAFDLATEAWTKIETKGAVPVKRCLTRCLWLPPSKKMLLFGGQTDGTPFLGDFWSLDVASGVWSELKPVVVPGPRNLYGATSGPTVARWYIFGGNTADGPTGETWMYDVNAGTWIRFDTSPAPPARYSTDTVFAAGRLFAFGGNDGNAELSDGWTLPLGA